MWNTLKRAGTVFPLLMLIAVPGQAQHHSPLKTEMYNGHEVVAQEVLVRFRPTTPLTSIIQAEAAQGIDRAEGVGGIGVLRLHSASRTVAALIRNLTVRGDVEYAEPNYILHAVAIPNDPRFGELWGLQNTGQTILGVPGTSGADIRATLAWDVSTGSRAAVITVIDTGIDYTHPDLAANVWSAPSAFTVNIGGQAISCPTGSHGFNAIAKVCDPLDDNLSSHGTHVSGTVGAVGNNGVGVVGVNWNATIMGSKFLDAGGSGITSDAINAIEFAIQAKTAFGGVGGSANVRVLSNSWGGGAFSQALLDEINSANTNGMLFVGAAGNNSSNNDTTAFYPASYNASNVVAVSATDNKDGLASFSNFGATTVDLGAPGVNVLSTTRGGNFGYLSGTSMATPHVSGAALLILSACPLLNTADLKANILANVDPIPSLSGKTVTGGRLNVNKAIRACGPDFGLSATPSSQTTTGDPVSYRVQVSAKNGFTGNVTLSANCRAFIATCDFSPNPVTGGSGFSTMDVSPVPPVRPGTLTITITGTAGALVHTTTVTLVFQP